MRTHFCMLYCADKHKMACFVFIACRCCLCALFLLSAALCCLAHNKADLERRRSRRQPKADKEHNQNDAPDEEHARASCCDFVNKGSSRCDDQRAPFAPFSINLLPFFCCQDNSTKAYTQIHTNCRQGKEHEDQTDNTSARLH